MNTTKKILLPLLISSGAIASSVWAHATLESAVPGKNAELATAPTEVRLRFNENLEGNFSSIKVIDAGGKDVVPKKATVDAADQKILHAPLDLIQPGKYKVKWVGVGHDGHRRTGDYTFSVR